MSVAEVVTDQHPGNGWAVSDRGSHRQRSQVAGSVLSFCAFDASPASVRSAVNDVNDVTVVEPATCMWAQLTQQFDVVVIDGRTPLQ